MLLARIMPRKDSLHLQLVLTRQRRNLDALPTAPIEFPSVITAFHTLPIKSPIGKRNSAMRTTIPHRKCSAVIRPPQHQRHLQQHRFHQTSSPYRGTPCRRIPKIPQKTRIPNPLSLLRGLQFINEIFFNRHRPSLRYRPTSNHWDSSYSNQPKADLRGNVVGDILMLVAMRFSTFH